MILFWIFVNSITIRKKPSFLENSSKKNMILANSIHNGKTIFVLLVNIIVFFMKLSAIYV